MRERQITLKHLYFQDRKWIGLKFYPDKVIQAIVKQLPGRKWSEKFGMIVLPNNQENLTAIFDSFKGVAWVNTKYFFVNRPVSTSGAQLSVDSYRRRPPRAGWKYCPEEFYRKLEIRGYSINTAKIYIMMFERFINHFPDNSDPMALDENDVRGFLQQLVKEKRSESYLNQSINAVKFYYEVVKEMPNRFYSIERPIQREKLPEVLSKEEVKKLLLFTNNIKHRCIISLLYSAGLRRNELLNLKLEDIDSHRMTIRVNGGKGKKDRFTILGKSVLDDLRQYYKACKPHVYLFEGATGKPYSGSSVLKVIKRSAKKAGIRRRVYPHILRHSFGTHLLENGTDLRQIQLLLGHNSLDTTEIYTHVASKDLASVKNLLD